ncbi:MAG: hypothetical protein NTV49_02450 [Kiritimatiellaeota bacterium]|nr:hypothetical protein [Kiritimatiellota bacterium]
MQHGQTQPAGGHEVGIVRLDGGADHDRRGLRGDAGTVLWNKPGAGAGQHLQHSQIAAALIPKTIRAGDAAALVQQCLRQGAHADAGYADQVIMTGL